MLTVAFPRGTVPLDWFLPLRVVTMSARSVVCCFRLIIVEKLQMRTDSAQQKQAMTSGICRGHDLCSVWLTSMLFVVYFNDCQGSACKSSMSGVALSERTQRKSDGTAPLVRHDASWESVFRSVAKRSRRSEGHHNFVRLEECFRNTCLFFTLQDHQRHRLHFRWVAHR